MRQGLFRRWINLSMVVVEGRKTAEKLSKPLIYLNFITNPL
jgi:hypothetical protein